MNVIKEDASLIQRFIDQENSSMLNFEEFLFALRGKPNEERQNAINYVFSIFDNGSGVADVNQMKQVFNCQRHPKFTMGKLNEAQIFYFSLKILKCCSKVKKNIVIIKKNNILHYH